MDRLLQAVPPTTEEQETHGKHMNSTGVPTKVDCQLQSMQVEHHSSSTVSTNAADPQDQPEPCLRCLQEHSPWQ